MREFHYFFYGMCSENVLSDFIGAAEKKGCEFLSVHPGIASSNTALVQGNGKPQAVQVFRVFVRCLKTDWERIEGEMQDDARAEQRAKTGMGR